MPNPVQLRRVIYPGASSAGAAATVSAEALQFLSRLLTAPDSTRQAAIIALIDALVAAGVWTKLEALCLVGADEGTSLTNFIQADYQAERYEGAGPLAFVADDGYTTPSNLSFLTSNFNPSTSGSALYTRTSAMVMAWNGINGADNKSVKMLDLSAAHVGLWPESGGRCYYSINESGEPDVANAGNRTGLFCIQRTGANATQAFRNGVSLGTLTTASEALYNSEIALTCQHKWRGHAIGAPLTVGEHTAFYNAIAAYSIAVTGGVP